MKPEQLHAWQPQATDEQLRQFITENPSLFMLMDEAWRKFQQTHSALFNETALPTRPYAPNMRPEELTHHPISESELVQFLQMFDRNQRHKDRPFGDNPNIQEQDWTLDESI